MVAIADSLNMTSARHLRPLNVHRDLLAVADLIELCFSSTMDADGEQYLRQMRQLAKDEGYFRWMMGDLEQSTTPFSGFVWEEDGRLVGNLNLIPLNKQGKRVYFIANVAVHPDYRRRGIARSLTQEALDYVQSRPVSAVWLQVRAENLPAHQLYESEGFLDQAIRNTWQVSPLKFSHPDRKDRRIVLSNRYSSDWDFQKTWLDNNYPAEVAWNLPIKTDTFKPNLFSEFLRFLNGSPVNHWAARWNSHLLGTLTFEATTTSTDNLWLAATPETEENVITNLTPFVIYSLNTQRPLSLNYPAGRAEDAFRSAGLILHQTLIWMEAKL
jgi:ribosomal protein S18 acetylase RimI-like enzyme